MSLWDLNGEGAGEAAASIAADCGVVTHSRGLDVTDGAAVAEAVAAAREALGTIGGLVHAAGIVTAVDIDNLTEEIWDSVLGVNLRAQVFTVKALLDDLRRHEGSAIVGIGSIMSVVGNALIPSYTSSKHGVVGLTKSLANHLGTDGIRVNAVCPGYIHTPMMAPGDGRPPEQSRPDREDPPGPGGHSRRHRQGRPLPHVRPGRVRNRHHPHPSTAASPATTEAGLRIPGEVRSALAYNSLNCRAVAKASMRLRACSFTNSDCM